MNPALLLIAGLAATWLLFRGYRRVQLSLAKHPSLRGHSKISRRIARLLPYYEYDEQQFFACDGADAVTVRRRRNGFYALARRLAERSPRTHAMTAALGASVSDSNFTSAYRVPFQFRSLVRQHLGTAAFAAATDRVRIQDIDGNWSYDVAGSYGVNLLGYEVYKDIIDRAGKKVGKLGPVLGPYHPVVADNVSRLKTISGLDEISFHMSGTEAVMQAVGLARYHTRRPRAVVFCGAYHGWWDGVQPGVGSQRRVNDVYTLKEMSDATLRVLETRKDIACVLVNPLQALHPNAAPGSDGTLLDGRRDGNYDRDAYTAWLQRLREVCTARGIVLIFDEVFVGFRLGLRGAQAYFGVQADMVTYGKTLGGGLPVGALAGRAELMKRYREERPADVCFARGTFNSHPYVMAAMNEFLKLAMQPATTQELESAEATWNARAERLNEAFRREQLPLAIANMTSIWILGYSRPGRYHWMLQYYLRAAGLSLSWVGTGRFIFSHDYTDQDFDELSDRIVEAAKTMRADGWWTQPAGMSHSSIRRSVLREVLAARLGRPVAAAAPVANAATSEAESET